MLSLLTWFLKKGTDSFVHKVQAGTTCVDPGPDIGSWTCLIKQGKSNFANSFANVEMMALNQVLQRMYQLMVY